MADRDSKIDSTDNQKKPYVPPVVTNLGDVVQATLGDLRQQGMEDFTWGWISVQAEVGVPRLSTKKRRDS